jgi:hypothetical protein
MYDHLKEMYPQLREAWCKNNITYDGTTFVQGPHEYTVPSNMDGWVVYARCKYCMQKSSV